METKMFRSGEISMVLVRRLSYYQFFTDYYIVVVTCGDDRVTALRNEANPAQVVGVRCCVQRGVVAGYFLLVVVDYYNYTQAEGLLQLSSPISIYLNYCIKVA